MLATRSVQVCFQAFTLKIRFILSRFNLQLVCFLWAGLKGVWVMQMCVRFDYLPFEVTEEAWCILRYILC